MLTLQEREALYIPWLEEYIRGNVNEEESCGGLCLFLSSRLKDKMGAGSVRACYDVESYRLALCLFDSLRNWKGRLYSRPVYIGKEVGLTPERIDAARKILAFLKLWA